LTAEKNTITVWKAQVKGDLLQTSFLKPDIVLVNNDFSVGIPGLIKKIIQPLVPTPAIGWHTRKKSDHFNHYRSLIEDFAKILGCDAWLLRAEHSHMDDIDFSKPEVLSALGHKVDAILGRLRSKFQQYNIKDTPYVFIKNDAGTYGMAVMTVESGDELLHLNKKQRTHMKMGKGSRPVTEVIIQEGIPTIDRFKGLVAEPVIYLVNNEVAGGFFRLNEKSGFKGNLNQPGMKFSKLCFHEMTGYSIDKLGFAALEPARPNPGRLRARASSALTRHATLSEAAVRSQLSDLSSVAILYKHIARIASLAAGCEIKHATTTYEEKT